MKIKCEVCMSDIEIVPPQNWRQEQYATCPKCGNRNSRSSVVKQIRLTTRAGDGLRRA